MLFSFRSAISCAIRMSARRTAAAFSTWVDPLMVQKMKKLFLAERLLKFGNNVSSVPCQPRGANLKEPANSMRYAGVRVGVWRDFLHFERCLMIQSVNARSNPMSDR